jgi:molybdenum cofactor sulfurtransferase
VKIGSPLTRRDSGLPVKMRCRRSFDAEVGQAILFSENKEDGSMQKFSTTHQVPVSAEPEGTRALNAAFDDFRKSYPDFERTSRLDVLRAEEFSRLDEQQHVYLDYTGGSQYAETQIDEHTALLKHNIFGNPHSDNPSSLASTALGEHAREYVLQYFHAPPEEYAVIFTQNASGALKLVGESYPFSPDSRYLLTFDNHNAVNGIREFARSRSACITYVPVVAPELRIDGNHLADELAQPNPKGSNLFVFPAQSNFSGVQHSLDWIARAQSYGWDVVLDAAAFVPTNTLDVGVHHPDFVSLSFYKMFGYPTGVGCLIARKSALTKLRRPWFSGGTIEIASVQGDRYALAEGERAFEDGTINYLNLPAIEIGLKFLERVDVRLLHDRIGYLTGWLLQHLSSLRHSNGAPLVEIYGPRDLVDRGGTIALNFHDPRGEVFNFHRIEQEASKSNISLRTGCFCNPGAGEIAFGLTGSDMRECFVHHERASFERCLIAMKGKTAGAVRVALGIASNFPDVFRFVRFAQTFIDKQAA